MPMRQMLLTEFRQVLRSVKNGSYPYRPREPTPIPWHRYDMAQVNELPEVISLIGGLIDTVDVGMSADSFCAKQGIEHILGSTGKPTTQGKIERFFQTFERYYPRFNDVERFRRYYNDKPHTATAAGRP